MIALAVLAGLMLATAICTRGRERVLAIFATLLAAGGVLTRL